MNSHFDKNKPVAIGSDHAGFDYKEDLISFLEAKEIPYQDFGTHSKDSVDYPDFAHPVASAVENEEASFGILICGSAMVWRSRLINTRAFVLLFAGVRNLLNFRAFITTPILFVFLPALCAKAMQKKWCNYL